MWPQFGLGFTNAIVELNVDCSCDWSQHTNSGVRSLSMLSNEKIVKGWLIKMLVCLGKFLIISFVVAFAASCSAFKSGYDESLLKSREAILKDDLIQMRKLIKEYAADRGELPQSLEDLAKAGYLHEVPEDPITQKKDWKVVMGKDPNLAKGKRGIIDVLSSSTAKSLEGTPYDKW
jgi:general secretion pathway protein G